MTHLLLSILFAGLSVAGGAWAQHDSHTTNKADKKTVSAGEKSFGRAGDPAKAARTIAIDMSDNMRYTPAAVAVKSGETVKFVLKNSGKIMHEFVLGSMQDLKAHAERMKKHPGMEHDAPYMVHVAPGKTGTIVWHFTNSGEFQFGCLIPGHFEAGMIGRIIVSK